MRDVGLELRKEFEEAEEALAIEPQADPVAEQIVAKYNVADAAIAEMRERFKGLTIAGVEDKKGYALVHAARMEVRDKRLAVERTRKMLKEDSLEYGRKVDREAKRITTALQPIEDALEAEEKRIDAELEAIKVKKQAEAQAKIQARVDALVKVGSPISLAEITNMSDTAFEFALAHATEAWEAKEKVRIAAEEALAKQEAERKAAEERAAAERQAAEAAERERMEKVRAEQEAMAQRLAEQRAELERQAAALKAKEEAQERAAREEAFRKQAEADAKAKAEREAKEAQEKAAREQAEAEAKRKAAEAARPDAEKIRALAKVIRETGFPKLSTEAGQAAMTEIENAVQRLAAFIEKKADALAPITFTAP